VRELLAKMSGSAPPPNLAKAVFLETEGNPFFVEEVYQHLSEEGKLFDASGGWKSDLRVDTIEVPEGVRLVIGRRLDRLGESARKALTAAAVIGRTFPLDVLQVCVDLSDDEVLDAIEEAERAQLVAADTSQRNARYGFVHELIRTTLLNSLSLPRRQRLHLKIADALERLRASSLESDAPVLAHHLYQAGAVADVDRTARFLLLAARRALASAAFEEALEVLDNLLSLELPDYDGRLGEIYEHRGEALAGLQRHEDAAAAFDRALTISIAIKDDAGIGRAAIGASNLYIWRGQLAEAVGPLTRSLGALSNEAARERALLLSWLATARMSAAHLDENWQCLEEAAALAERVTDPVLIGRVLTAKGISQRMCGDYEAASATCQQALPLAGGSMWDRADLLSQLVVAETYMGRLASAVQFLPQLEAAARRAGHHGALYAHAFYSDVIEATQTGSLRASLERSMRTLEGGHFRYLTRTAVGRSLLYLGEIDHALEQLAVVVEEQPREHWLQGIPEANLFAATALAGHHARARALIPTVVAKLPEPRRRNVQGAFTALDTFITGLSIIGDREASKTLYPLTLDYVQTGQVFSLLAIGPSNPQLAAALAADAAGLVDRSREHFEIALRQAREVPMRLLLPTVLYWYGRALSAAPDAADRARGRAIVEASGVDFRALDMVLHANLAEQFLRE
jgi:tetratricopeptide (TPR) repeat protein